MGRPKTPIPPGVPPPAKDGIRTRFDPVTEHRLRKKAKSLGFATLQDYLRHLARLDVHNSTK